MKYVDLACSCGASWSGWTDMVALLRKNWNARHKGPGHKHRKPYRPKGKKDDH